MKQQEINNLLLIQDSIKKTQEICEKAKLWNDDIAKRINNALSTNPTHHLLYMVTCLERTNMLDAKNLDNVLNWHESKDDKRPFVFAEFRTICENAKLWNDDVATKLIIGLAQNSDYNVAKKLKPLERKNCLTEETIHIVLNWFQTEDEEWLDALDDEVKRLKEQEKNRLLLLQNAIDGTKKNSKNLWDEKFSKIIETALSKNPTHDIPGMINCLERAGMLDAKNINNVLSWFESNDERLWVFDAVRTICVKAKLWNDNIAKKLINGLMQNPDYNLAHTLNLLVHHNYLTEKTLEVVLNAFQTNDKMLIKLDELVTTLSRLNGMALELFSISSDIENAKKNLSSYQREAKHLSEKEAPVVDTQIHKFERLITDKVTDKEELLAAISVACNDEKLHGRTFSVPNNPDHLINEATKFFKISIDNLFAEALKNIDVKDAKTNLKAKKISLLDQFAVMKKPSPKIEASDDLFGLLAQNIHKIQNRADLGTYDSKSLKELCISQLKFIDNETMQADFKSLILVKNENDLDKLKYNEEALFDQIGVICRTLKIKVDILVLSDEKKTMKQVIFDQEGKQYSFVILTKNFQRKDDSMIYLVKHKDQYTSLDARLDGGLSSPAINLLK